MRFRNPAFEEHAGVFIKNEEQVEVALRPDRISEVDIRQSFELLPDVGHNTPMGRRLREMDENLLAQNGFTVLESGSIK